MSDDRIKELNPIICNSVCTVLHAFNHYEKAHAAARFVDFNFRMIPKHWNPLRYSLNTFGYGVEARRPVSVAEYVVRGATRYWPLSATKHQTVLESDTSFDQVGIAQCGLAVQTASAAFVPHSRVP